MKIVKHKLFWAWKHEDEEKWINEMSESGLQLCHVGFCRYVFEEGEPSAYQYRLQFLEKSPSNPDSIEYISFMEDAGLEYVGFLGHWVYFRKKNGGTDFELFSDMKSIIKHFDRILKFCIAILVALTLSVTNLIFNMTLNFNYGFLGFIVIFSFFIIFCAIGTFSLYKKKKQLVKAAEIQE